MEYQIMYDVTTLPGRVRDHVLRGKPLHALPGLLSDEEINHLCRTKQMITPYAPEGISIPGRISHGTTSYGYDARLAPEYKIFSNTKASAIIDPKAFDQGVYVDHAGPDCIIPPHGFALGRTVEYFKIPNDVLAICMSRSTYARCFTGDTTVALADGTTMAFTEMVTRFRAGQTFQGLTINPATGVVETTELTAPRRIGREAVIEIVLNNDAVIKVTPDHVFLIQVGMDIEEVQAKDLTLNMQFAWFNYNCATPQKIKYIAPVLGDQDVYCLTSEKYGNFALGAGPFVNNCGIHLLTTPLEPGWEGHVTLEIMNAASLPARVYGDEGICQFLFFRGASPCKKSYADKKGKYQSQTGITLPIVR